MLRTTDNENRVSKDPCTIFKMTALRTLLLSLLLASVGCGSGTDAARELSQRAARLSAESWGALIDAGRYDDAWTQAAALARTSGNREQWIAGLRDARASMGELQSRILKDASYTDRLPNAPAGEYYVIQYQSIFVNRISANETLVMVLEPDGRWRVAGYYIR